MKNCSKPQRVIAIALVVSLLAGLIPTVALAARNGEIPDIIEYKAMSLVNLQGGEWLSRYEYAQEDNTFYSDVNLNVPSLLRIGFTIEKSQYVNLALYELKDSAVLDGGDGYPHAHLEYYFDPEAPDFGASVPEDFLGAKIGYISGVPVLDNIVDPDPNADTVEYNRISEERWAEIIQHTYDTGMSEKKPMIDVYAYGFKGEKLPEPAAAATQMADAGPGEEDDSVYSYAPDTDTIAGMPVEVNVEGAKTLSEEELTSLDRDTTADEVPEIDASEPPVGDEERPAEKETAGQNGDTVDNVGIEAHTTEIATKAEEPAQGSLLPISDVLYHSFL